MTAVAIAAGPSVGPWTIRPGWGIAVDLTPPQLLKSRKVRTLRRLVAAGLGLIVLGCAAGYFLAARERASAQDTLAGAQVQSAQLHSDLAQYSTVTRINSTVAGVRQQISTALAGDVATDELLTRIRAALPSDMTILQASVTVSPAAAAGTTAGTGLNDSDHPRIGDVTISGSSHSLADLSTFVDHLQQEIGFVDVIPATNTADKTGGVYSVTLGFTDQLLTQVGGK